jgi:hypothetical protein
MGAPRDPDRVLRRLKLRQLRLLVAVGAHGNIQGAARDLASASPPPPR